MKHVLFFSVILACAGCATQVPSHRVAEGPKVKRELMVLTPEQERALRLPEASDGVSAASSDVLIEPDVIAYPIAGRQDPNHPDVAYLGTWALRRTAPKWKLQPAPSREILFSPGRSEGRQELKPVQKQEVETLLLEQRALNDENRQAITRLIRIQKDQQKQIAEIHQAVVAKQKTEKTDNSSGDTSAPEKAALNGEPVKTSPASP